jgi:hypothetical protein
MGFEKLLWLLVVEGKMPLHLSMDGTHPVEGIYIHTQVAHAELQPKKTQKVLMLAMC